MGTLMQTKGRVAARLIGVREASTFLGFCEKHDAETFAPLETKPFQATAEQCFLLAYRALTKELYAKAAYIASLPLLRESDKGHPLRVQVAIQHQIDLMEAAAKESLANLNHHKSLFDTDLTSGDYSNIRFTVFQITPGPDVVCGGMTAPEFAFDGTQLQEMDELGVDRWDLISLSLIATEDGGAAVFAWRANSDASAKALVESLLALKPDEQPHALVRFALEHLENTFLAPPWWEGLAPAVRSALETRMSHGAAPELPTQPDSLADDGIRAVNWHVVRIDRNW